MYAGAPVLASKTGGPLETVLDGKTGFLRENTPEEFGKVMASLIARPQLGLELGMAAHDHVKANFGTKAFETALESAVNQTLTRRTYPRQSKAKAP